MQEVDERLELLKLLDLLSKKNWDDLTTVKTIFATEKWDVLIDELENNYLITEKQFLCIIDEG